MDKNLKRIITSDGKMSTESVTLTTDDNGALECYGLAK